MRQLLRIAVFAALSLAAAFDAAAQSRQRDAGRPGDFDFLVLALSWSPSYCEAEGRNADPQQCNAAHPLGFVVHGLWPQYEQGSPQRCETAQRNVPRDLARSVGDLIPSPGLVQHEWRTHGTCSGLSQSAYFALLRKARERVVIPAPLRNLAGRRSIGPREIEQLFVRANPGLAPDALAVTCDRDIFREVRICLSKDLGFRACPEVDRRACRRRVMQLPPMGGN